jgi:myo-inositol 2-dehydrogenase / D-chiro-inositol 1-dehydrogenase
MPPSPVYGLLLVTGLHTHQENYARAFAADPRCRLVGLTDESDVSARRRELNEQLAAELRVPYLEDFDTAVHRADVDAVCICAEPERRAALTIRAARAGKHVYLDKEPAARLEDAWEVAAAVSAAGVRSQTFSLVRSPAAHLARQVVNSGRVGELIGLHCEMFFAKGVAGTADLSRPRREQTEVERLTFIDSKRELLCVGWYPLVLFQWLTGRKIESVIGTTSNYFFAEHQKNGVEDFSCLMLRMEGGIEATITVGRTGWSSHPSHGVHQVHLVGTEGVETVDADRPRLEVYSDATPWRQPSVPHPDDPMGFWSSTQQAGGVIPKTDWHPVAAARQSDAAYFLDCIGQDRESDVPASLAVHTFEAILAGYQSAATGRMVDLPV